MTDQTEPMDRMREDYRVVVRHRRAKGLWTAADEAEAHELIREAVEGAGSDRGMRELLECWRAWLAQEAEIIRRETGMRPRSPSDSAAVETVTSRQAENFAASAHLRKRGPL